MEAFISGAWRTITRGEALVGGQWRRLTRAEAYIGGQWRLIAAFVGPLSVSVSPPSASGYATPLKPTTQTITTNTVTATPVGGLGPFTYSWTSGNTPTLASNSFTATLAGNTQQSTSSTVTVTDSLGSTAQASIDVEFTNEAQIG